MRQESRFDTVRMPWSIEVETEDESQPGSVGPPAGYPEMVGACRCPERCGTLHGTVLDVHGEAIRDFLVVAHWRPRAGCLIQAKSELGRTDEQGRYSFDIPACGHAMVTFDEDPSYFRLSDIEDMPEDGEDDDDRSCDWFEPVERGVTLEWPTVRVRHTGCISGHVVDESGAALAGVSVTVKSTHEAHDGMSNGYWARTESDQSGRFSLSGLRCLHGHLTFSTLDDSYAIIDLAIGDADDGSDICLRQQWICQDLLVVLPAAARVHVELADENGAAVPLLHVRPVPEAPVERGVFIPSLRGAGDASRGTLNRVPCGNYRFEVMVPSCGRERPGVGDNRMACEGVEWRRTSPGSALVVEGENRVTLVLEPSRNVDECGEALR